MKDEQKERKKEKIVNSNPYMTVVMDFDMMKRVSDPNFSAYNKQICFGGEYTLFGICCCCQTVVAST